MLTGAEFGNFAETCAGHSCLSATPILKNRSQSCYITACTESIDRNSCPAAMSIRLLGLTLVVALLGCVAAGKEDWERSKYIPYLCSLEPAVACRGFAQVAQSPMAF